MNFVSSAPVTISGTISGTDHGLINPIRTSPHLCQQGTLYGMALRKGRVVGRGMSPPLSDSRIRSAVENLAAGESRIFGKEVDQG